MRIDRQMPARSGTSRSGWMEVDDLPSALTKPYRWRDVAPQPANELDPPSGRLDWRVRSWLSGMELIGWPSVMERTPAQARMDLRLLLAATSMWRAVGQVGEALVTGSGRDVPVRIYTPLTSKAPRPLLVWFHGGGFVMGDLVTADPTCRALADRSGAVVVSVDYRLAPEHGCLDGADDAYEATRWAMRNARALGADPHRIAIGGESAGATLAAVVSQRCRDNGDPMPARQVLVYPCTDLSMRLSNRDLDVANFLTWDTVDWFAKHCFATLDPTDPRISPANAGDLAGLPPAILITAECDLLCTDGEEYGARLRRAGVAVEHHRFAGQIHGFFTMDLILPAARRAQGCVASFLRSMPPQDSVSATTTSAPVTWLSPIARLLGLAEDWTYRFPPVLVAQVLATLVSHRIDRFASGSPEPQD